MRAAILAGVAALVAAKDPSTTMLNEWPMIQAHDAATTYLARGKLHPINAWTKTQADGGVTGMLDCGARAFDWRPRLAKGKLIMHHGPISVKHSMNVSLGEMLHWAGSKGTSKHDLLVLVINQSDGDGCDAAVRSLLNQRRISYITDCSRLRGLTAAAAFDLGALPGGGAIVATSCFQSNYDKTVACSGFGSKLEGELAVPVEVGVGVARVEGPIGRPTSHLPRAGLNATAKAAMYTCYSDSRSKAFPVERMWTYINQITAAGPPENGSLYSVQTLWQETPNSIVVGEFHASSLLKDEEKSGLNVMLADAITSGQWNASRIGQVKVNNVCDGGAQLLAALRSIA